ncbi:MAG: MBOAT family protein [Chloroflexi bacterium]|nr:MBOAT family protein [Chloroflexota bacterium]
MLFPTLQFVLFFLLVFPVSWLLRWRDQPWKVFILAASYVFYAAWDWRFVGLIIASTAINSALARVIARPADGPRRAALTAALIFNLGLLGAFKYYGFFIASFNDLARGVGLPARMPFLEIILPVGISFFTFQAISYVVDVYRRQIEPVALLDFAVYLAFFPHLVAGPIVRVVEFVPQLPKPRLLTRAEVTRAGLLIGGGLFKKVAISSYVAAAIVDPVFAAPSRHSAPETLLAMYGYAVQIYCDFSGYTDMAIGLALLLGIRFPQNFNRPYTAASLQEFWRRWHMTLSRWLRDYLYIPLGGSRHGRAATYRNLLLTMALGGLWHGAAMTFVVWGVYHGLGLAAERWLEERRAARAAVRAQAETAWVRSFSRRLADSAAPAPEAPWRQWLGRFVTFQLVCIGWVIFRSQSLEAAGELLWRSVTAWGPAPLASLGVVAVIAGAVAWQYLPEGLWRRIEDRFGALPVLAQGAALGVIIALAIILGPTGVAPFIYFQF